MSDRDIPNLFGWGCSVPVELENYLQLLDAAVRREGAEGKSPTVRFAFEGVSRTAEHYIAKLQHDREALLDEREMKLSYEVPRFVSHEVRTWTFMLHAYCGKWKQPAPPALLQLTFQVLRLKEGQPADDVAKHFAGVDGVSNLSGFFEAASLDGKADAAGESLSLSELERATSVSRKTLRGWREKRRYKASRAFAAFSSRKWDS